MTSEAGQDPPRNGEGDHPQDGGGADLRRASHRTVGAAADNVRFARGLRRTMTLPEVLLWQQLRGRRGAFRFRRQFPCNGFVLDFACLERRLAIEVDGEAHSMGDRPKQDALRTARLAELGFDTLRIPAREVLDNLQGVLTLILDRCENRPLHHAASRRSPPPRSGEE